MRAGGVQGTDRTGVALYPLSYRPMAGRVGFEPTTSRVTVEVTEFFTTGRPLCANANDLSITAVVAQLFRRRLRRDGA